MSYSIGKVGYVPARVTTLPSEHVDPPPAASGCGDYVSYLEYESGQLGREQTAERKERYTPHDASLPADWKPGAEPYPWVLERRERVAVAGELMEQGLRGTELDGAIDLTVFARRFLRWAEEGFPITKG